MGINDSPSMSQVATEFGGSAPHSLSEYYGVQFSDGSYAPSSDTISLSDFRNKSSDTTAPVITLTGSSSLVLEATSGSYSDPGATADTGETVTVNSSSVNMSTSGTYTVTYTATDSSGNIGTASRTVRILAREPLSGGYGYYDYYNGSQNQYGYRDWHGPCEAFAVDDVLWQGVSTAVTSMPYYDGSFWEYRIIGSWVFYERSIACGVPPPLGLYQPGRLYYKVYRVERE